MAGREGRVSLILSDSFESIFLTLPSIFFGSDCGGEIDLTFGGKSEISPISDFCLSDDNFGAAVLVHNVEDVVGDDDKVDLVEQRFSRCLITLVEDSEI